MFLLKILDLKDKVSLVEKWLDQPAESAKEYAKDVVMGYVSAYIFAVVVVLGALGLLGFTPLLGGPHQPARILLYALLVVVLIVGLILLFAWYKFKNLLKKALRSYHKKAARTVSYEIKDEKKIDRF